MNSTPRVLSKAYITAIIIFSIGLAIFITLFFSTRSYLANDDDTEQLYVGLSILFSFLVSMSISLLCFPFITYVVQRFSWHDAPLQRTIFNLLISIIVPTLSASFWLTIFYYAFGKSESMNDTSTSVDYFDHIFTAIIITVFVVLASELRSLYVFWKESIIEKEKFKRQAIEYQYNALTTQLDPHFLFNALNLLSSLVRSKDDNAIVFIDNFSDVYRYVLNAKNQLVVTLKEELALVDKYLSLQKLRYQHNLSYSMALSYDDNALLLPPLSIQLLVENAIKHNIISASKPLEITIKAKNNLLTISNNYQPRKNIESNGMGHKILEQRYSQLTETIPTFEITNGNYIAKIPLLNEE